MGKKVKLNPEQAVLSYCEQPKGVLYLIVKLNAKIRLPVTVNLEIHYLVYLANLV